MGEPKFNANAVVVLNANQQSEYCAEPKSIILKQCGMLLTTLWSFITTYDYIPAWVICRSLDLNNRQKNNLSWCPKILDYYKLLVRRGTVFLESLETRGASDEIKTRQERQTFTLGPNGPLVE